MRENLPNLPQRVENRGRGDLTLILKWVKIVGGAKPLPPTLPLPLLREGGRGIGCKTIFVRLLVPVMADAIYKLKFTLSKKLRIKREGNSNVRENINPMYRRWPGLRSR